MKIYADRQSNLSLDKYIGKDVWVRVTYYDEDELDVRWFRILSVKPSITPGFERWYRVNCIYEIDNYMYVGHREQFDKDIQKVCVYRKGQFVVRKPVEVLTTDELYDWMVESAKEEGWV